MLQENENNHYHIDFNFQHSILESLVIVQRSILNLSHPSLNFQVSFINLSPSDIRLLYSLQIDNDIQQCVKRSWTGIFKNKFVVHGLQIRFQTPPLISINQKW